MSSSFESNIENKLNNISELIGALIGLARTAENNVTERTTKIIYESLSLIISDFNKQNDSFINQTAIIRQERFALAPMCRECTSPCGRTSEYDIKQILSTDDEIRAFKIQLLNSLIQLGYNLNYASKYGYSDSHADALDQTGTLARTGTLLCEGLFLLGYDCDKYTLFSIIKRLNKALIECIEFNENV